jgi:PDZ domain-containing protein
VPERRRVSRWVWVASGVAVVVLIAAIAGFWVRLPYYTISPGGDLAVGPRVTINGARSYKPDGDVLLLFVRERARVNVWRYVQARLDSEIDLFREQDITQGQSQDDLRTQAQADMVNSQMNAKKVALEVVGYDVPSEPGAVIQGVLSSVPATGVLKPRDIVLSVDGKPVKEPSDLGEVVRTHEPGDTLTLRIRRDGKQRTEHVRTTRSKEGRTQLGVLVAASYDFPVDISIDTSDIGGPSAGLAMTLAIIDELSPGNLTGGKRVATTGTISSDGEVGPIGGIEQKTVAARSAGADLFLVPKCDDTDATAKASCEHDLARARKRAGDLPVVPVGSIDEALTALRKAGGDPVPVEQRAA